MYSSKPHIKQRCSLSNRTQSSPARKDRRVLTSRLSGSGATFVRLLLILIVLAQVSWVCFSLPLSYFLAVASLFGFFLTSWVISLLVLSLVSWVISLLVFLLTSWVGSLPIFLLVSWVASLLVFLLVSWVGSFLLLT